MTSLHAFIISWDGMRDKANAIAQAIESEVDVLTVIHSSKNEESGGGTGSWEVVPNSWFYGRKFSRSLKLFCCDIHLQIQSDAQCDDWAMLVRRVRETFELHRVGLWAPLLSGTPWNSENTGVGFIDEFYEQTLQTDGIVWAFNAEVNERLKLANYDVNNLGWGIDWLAITYCYSNGLLVLRDHRIKVLHPVSSGYNKIEAYSQMTRFLENFTSNEIVLYRIFSKHCESLQKLQM